MLDMDRVTPSVGTPEEERVILLRLMVSPEQKDLFEAAGLMRQAPLSQSGHRPERIDGENAPPESPHRRPPLIRLTDNIPRIDGLHILHVIENRGFLIDLPRSYFKYFGKTAGSDLDLYLVVLEFSRSGMGPTPELKAALEELLQFPWKDVEIYENRTGRIRESITLRRPVFHRASALKLEFRTFERRWNVPFNGVQACA